MIATQHTLVEEASDSWTLQRLPHGMLLLGSCAYGEMGRLETRFFHLEGGSRPASYQNEHDPRLVDTEQQRLGCKGSAFSPFARWPTTLLAISLPVGIRTLLIDRSTRRSKVMLLPGEQFNGQIEQRRDTQQVAIVGQDRDRETWPVSGMSEPIVKNCQHCHWLWSREP